MILNKPDLFIAFARTQLVRNYFESRKNQLTLALVCGTIASIWPLYFINLFPLSEARDWLGWWSNDDIVQQFISNLFERNTRFSRDFSMLLTIGVGRMCESSVLCVNVALSIPLLIAVGALFALVNALTGRTMLAAFAACLWAISLPFLATAAWQATIHDRIGVMCALSAMALCWSLRPNASVLVCVLYSCTLTALTFAALNSKEAYWFLPPAVVLCHWFRSLDRPNNSLMSRDVILVLPLTMYSAWYFYRYLFVGELSVDWSHHVGSGDIGNNFFAYVRASFGTATIFVLLTSLLAFQLSQMWRKIDRRNRRKLLWCVVVILLSYAPIARTRFTTEYYLLAPLAIYFTLTAVVLSNGPVGLRYPAINTILSVVLAIIGVTIAISSHVATFYRERVALSTNFRETTVQKPNLTQATLESRSLCIVGDPQQAQTYLFSDSPFAWNVLRWDNKVQQLDALRTVPVYQSTRTDCALIRLDKYLN